MTPKQKLKFAADLQAHARSLIAEAKATLKDKARCKGKKLRPAKKAKASRYRPPAGAVSAAVDGRRFKAKAPKAVVVAASRGRKPLRNGHASH